MVMDVPNERMVLFGGTSADSAYNDVWSLNLEPGNDTWEKVFPSETPPPPRWFSTVTVDEANHRMIVFGRSGLRGSLVTTVCAGMVKTKTETHARRVFTSLVLKYELQE